MSIFDKALHIPAEVGFFQSPGRAFERVLLPVAARVSWRLDLVASIALLVGAACLSLGVAFALSPAADPGHPGFKIAVASLFLFVAVLPTGVFVTAIRDLLLPGACLVIDADGLCDARLGGEAMPWSGIARVALASGGSGPCAIRLTLVEAGPSRFNPCRAGGWSACWSRRRRERIVALLLLDQRPYVLAHTILTLAARHGIPVE